ncbi:hypothetical protein [Bosea sp. PAMC 26642]|uniref:hypothetical protein n=1 Tax=Bosea sp. (strain PAMC 26642) TaxID=1792307 RepID=UPI0012E8F7D7|nr:hypothetical protein [Bosea sp. PAMC 26642]
MEIVEQPKPNAGGSIVLAKFNCTARGFTMIGCALVISTQRDRRKIWPPKGVGQPGSRSGSIRIDDQALLKAMLDAARSTYRELRPTIERNAA